MGVSHVPAILCNQWHNYVVDVLPLFEFHFCFVDSLDRFGVKVVDQPAMRSVHIRDTFARCGPPNAVARPAEHDATFQGLVEGSGKRFFVHLEAKSRGGVKQHVLAKSNNSHSQQPSCARRHLLDPLRQHVLEIGVVLEIHFALELPKAVV